VNAALCQTILIHGLDSIYKWIAA